RYARYTLPISVADGAAVLVAGEAGRLARIGGHAVGADGGGALVAVRRDVGVIDLRDDVALPVADVGVAVAGDLGRGRLARGHVGEPADAGRAGARLAVGVGAGAAGPLRPRPPPPPPAATPPPAPPGGVGAGHDGGAAPAPPAGLGSAAGLAGAGAGAAAADAVDAVAGGALVGRRA